MNENALFCAAGTTIARVLRGENTCQLSPSLETFPVPLLQTPKKQWVPHTRSHPSLDKQCLFGETSTCSLSCLNSPDWIIKSHEHMRTATFRRLLTSRTADHLGMNPWTIAGWPSFMLSICPSPVEAYPAAPDLPEFQEATCPAMPVVSVVQVKSFSPGDQGWVPRDGTAVMPLVTNQL